MCWVGAPFINASAHALLRKSKRGLERGQGEGLSEKDIEFYHKIESIGSGELKGYDELTSSSWAASRHLDVLYKKEGLEFEIPLRRR